MVHGSIYIFKLNHAILLRESGFSFGWGSKKQIYSPLFVQAERGPWIFIREAFVIQMFGKSLWPRETRAEQNWNIFNKLRWLLETPSIVSTIPLKRDNPLPLGTKSAKKYFIISPNYFIFFSDTLHFSFHDMDPPKLSLLKEKLQVSKTSRHKTKI